MTIKQLGYLGFSVKDVPAWRKLLTSGLGLEEVESKHETALFRLDSRAWRISVDYGEEDDVTFAGFEVANAQSFERLTKKLINAGVEVKTGDVELAKRRGVLDIISLTDPYGLPLEIYYGATEAFNKPFVSPTGVSGFLTDEQGIGHIVRNVPDVQEAMTFYTELLDFKLSDIIEMSVGPDIVIPIYFFHCNGRHHTLALASMPMPKRIQHFMFEVKSLDDVGHAYDRLDNEDLITLTLGKHSNDHMISFYAMTPSGIEVEYGWDGRPVDDDWTVARHDTISAWGHKPVKQTLQV
ncbi:biphenyl-2,3-diol 1,2-dioxygenase [Niallia sp. Krafla_26]|uniref:biphenyl-2,3-diol 1,2-dioxygenase n=1 Tax=Niallia sp. Krafla_26 TaxID=3064703 RepID=UPI003D17B9BD